MLTRRLTPCANRFDRGAEIINQAKQKAGEVYDQANKRLSEQDEKAINYGRENPGKTTLIAFGVGVGVGALLVSNFGVRAAAAAAWWSRL